MWTRQLHSIAPPPLGRVVLVGFTFVFGATELAARLPHLLFLLGAVVYLYRLVALYRSTQVALFAAFAFALMPPVFHYTHTAYLEGGLLFFVAASMFYFLRHLRDGDRSDLLMAMLLTSAGFLYKRPALVALAVIGVYVLLAMANQRRWELRHLVSEYARAVWLCLAGVIPWLILVGWFAGPGRFLRYRYDVNIGNLLSPDLATGYLQQLPHQLSWPIIALVSVSLVYAIIVRRDALLGYALVWFSVFYVFFSIDGDTDLVLAGFDRFALVFIPPIAILLGGLATGISGLQYSRWFLPGVAVAVVVYLGLISTVVTFPHLDRKYASYLYAEGNVPLPTEGFGYWRQGIEPDQVGGTQFPFGSVFEYLGGESHNVGKLLIWHPNRIKFYSYKHEMQLNLYECGDAIYICRFETKEQLIGFSRDNEVNSVLIPVGLYYAGGWAWAQILSPALGQVLERGDLEPFELIERFDHGGFALLLLRVPDVGL